MSFQDHEEDFTPLQRDYRSLYNMKFRYFLNIILAFLGPDRSTGTDPLESDFRLDPDPQRWISTLLPYTRMQCSGSGMFIPDPNFFHPVSRKRIIEFKYFKPKFVSKLSKNMIRVVHPGSRSRFWILIFQPSRIRNIGFPVILYLEGADSVVLLLEKKGHSIVSLLYSSEVLRSESDRPFADPESTQVSRTNIFGHFVHAIRRYLCAVPVCK